MPTTINVNAAGYDLDVGGVTGSIVSGTLMLGASTDLGGQLRVKATTDTPSIIAQAYAGTSNAFEAWDASNNVVALISKIGAATFSGTVTADRMVINGAYAGLSVNSSGVVSEFGWTPLVGGVGVAANSAFGITSTTSAVTIKSNASQFYKANSHEFQYTDGTPGSSINAGAATFSGGISIVPAASATPASNGQLTFEATSNTSLTIKYKGSDGIVRSTVLTLS